MIRERDDSLLYTKIINYDPERAAEVVRDLIDCAEHYNMAGFAANQLGINQRICIVCSPRLITLLNPKVTKVSKEYLIDQEGCFSLPGYKAQIARHKFIEIDHGHPDHRIRSQFSGYLARIIQHEVDHLNGITIKMKVDRGDKFAQEIHGVEDGVRV